MKEFPPCNCQFVAVGTAMDEKDCKLHKGPYHCDECHCNDYRPSREFQPPRGKLAVADFYWPRCVCGHVAQAHN